jgi:hypothetical protein
MESVTAAPSSRDDWQRHLSSIGALIAADRFEKSLPDRPNGFKSRSDNRQSTHHVWLIWALRSQFSKPPPPPNQTRPTKAVWVCDPK